MKERFSGQRFPGHAKLLGLAATGGMMFGAGCADTGVVPKTAETQSPVATASIRATETPTQAAASPPKWYLTGGPHYDRLSGEVRYAIDIAPENPNKCPGGEPVTDSPFPSPVEGKVIVVGNKNNPSDPKFSTVEIATRSGEIIGAMHLADIRVKAGDEVNILQFLGYPSCDSPPGGRSEGTHIHLYRRGIDREPLPMAGVEFSEGIIYESDRNYDGSMRKGNITKTANTDHCGLESSTVICKGTRNDLSEPLRLVSTGYGSLRMELRFADGKPIPNQKAYIFETKKDINGNPVLGREVKQISSGNTGLLQATLPPGEYILLFDKRGSVKGGRFDETEDRVGIPKVDVRKDSTTERQIKLGRIIVNMKDDPQRPTKGSFTKLDTAQAEVCIDGLDDGKVHQIACIQLSDLGQDGVAGLSRAIFNLIPSGSYLLRYAWDDGFRGFEDYTARVDNTQGQTNVVSGQTIELTCLIFTPKVDGENQPADCTVRTVK